jgi:hypothetical protein
VSGHSQHAVSADSHGKVVYTRQNVWLLKYPACLDGLRSANKSLSAVKELSSETREMVFLPSNLVERLASAQDRDPYP